MKHTIKFANWLSKWNSFNDILTITVVTSVFVILVVLLLSLKRRKLFIFKSNNNNKSLFNSSSVGLGNYLVKKKTEKYYQPHHNWHLNDLLTQPTYCNVCECVMMVSGVCCTYCNLYADEKCLKKADKMFKCKQIFDNLNDLNENNLNNEKKTVRKWPHHWIKGNLKLNSVCCICNEDDAGSLPNLNDYKCVWCWRTAHESCLDRVSTPNLVEECNFGKLSRLLLRPNLISESTPSAILNLNEIKLNDSVRNGYSTYIKDWTPLIVFANPKSGNNDADEIIKNLTTLLNPLQVNFFLKL